MQNLSLISRFIIAFILLFSGIVKIMDLKSFAKTILAFKLMPAPLAIIFSKILPSIEITISFFLIFGYWLEYTIVIAIILFVVFSIAIAINLFRKNIIECGCFGKFGQKIAWKLVIRNIMIILMLVFVYYFSVLA